MVLARKKGSGEIGGLEWKFGLVELQWNPALLLDNTVRLVITASFFRLGKTAIYFLMKNRVNAVTS